MTAAILAVAIGACGTSAPGDLRRPNVIIILTDDQGYGDMSAHGNPVLETPNLDKLHDESVRLTDFHVAPVCTPTRGELMTGQYSLRNKAGMVPAGRNLMRRDVPTMPEVFAANGYATGLFGKWHLGDTYPHRPVDRGFERVVWHKGWGFASEIEYDNDYYYTRYLDQDIVRFSDRFCTDLWFDAAMEWMGEQADAGQPFFTYLALNTPHSPFNSLAKHYQAYGARVEDPLLAHFFGLIASIDENVARLDRWLGERGLRQNTLLLFMNDNGTAKGETVFNAGMRGKKGSPYDGGHRAIFFLRWPDGELGDPREIRYASHVADVLPTLADLVGLAVPQGASFDGDTLVPVFRSPDGTGADRKIVVQYGGRIRPEQYSDSAVIWNQWRLVGDSELYDIHADPGQKSNVADQNEEVVREMRAHYERYWSEIAESVEEVEPLVIRSGPGTFTDLTSNSWVEVDCDNRTRVAETCGPARGGVWQVDARAAGRYLVEVRRWPFHLERDLTKAGPAATIGGVLITPGKALAIRSAALSVNGANPTVSTAGKGARGVPFEVTLLEGRSTLQAWFRDASGRDISGAYYARVQRAE
ncbi:MAG: arylsulfatase [Bryobacterales bacterium]|nr:arylsulfatase [Bryobacterales bacterium]